MNRENMNIDIQNNIKNIKILELQYNNEYQGSDIEYGNKSFNIEHCKDFKCLNIYYGIEYTNKDIEYCNNCQDLY
jgi:hypothetical protein